MEGTPTTSDTSHPLQMGLSEDVARARAQARWDGFSQSAKQDVIFFVSAKLFTLYKARQDLAVKEAQLLNYAEWNRDRRLQHESEAQQTIVFGAATEDTQALLSDPASNVEELKLDGFTQQEFLTVDSVQQLFLATDTEPLDLVAFGISPSPQTPDVPLLPEETVLWIAGKYLQKPSAFSTIPLFAILPRFLDPRSVLGSLRPTQSLSLWYPRSPALNNAASYPSCDYSDMELSLPDRLGALRRLMEERNLDAYVVPSEDAHASEYLAPCDARRAWLTGFTGSAGCAVVTRSEARCWTDGRYWLQADKQLGPGWTLAKQGMPGVPTWSAWLKTEPNLRRIGIDPHLVPHSEATSLAASLTSRPSDPSSSTSTISSITTTTTPAPPIPSSTSISPPGSTSSAPTSTSPAPSPLVPVRENLVDLIWTDQPARPAEAVFRLGDEFAGEPVGQKLARVRERMKRTGAPGLVVSSLDEVAWLFNLRGSDIPYNPVFFAYAIVTKHDCTLFASPASLGMEIRNHLHSNGVAVLDYSAVWSTLESLGGRVRADREKGLPPSPEVESKDAVPGAEEPPKETAVVKTDKVLLGTRASWAIAKALGEGNFEVRRSIVEDLKAKKNATEMEGFRQSHIRDGAALVRYFAWLQEVLAGGEQWTEYDAAEMLEAFRKENKWFMGLSFDTISSTGANAAIIHYAPPKEGSAVIDPGKMYLCDSGAQYLDGTTDVTRTVHFGTPTEDERRAFTRVLQGHIALDSIVFPSGTTGYVIDAVARRPLWSDGLDYRHSTGHGVGHFLNVHEGPQGIGPRPVHNETGLEAGMVISNEPGYYADGQFGIRIENVVGIKTAETKSNFGGKGYLEMEHFTMCPVQTSLIDLGLLSAEEKEWINAYHAEVLAKLEPLLQEIGDTRAVTWLRAECAEV